MREISLKQALLAERRELSQRFSMALVHGKR